MKRMIVYLITMLVVLSVASGCVNSPSVSTEPPHVHEAQAGWERNATEHWQLCACGEKVNVSDHTLHEYTCTECGSEVFDYGDSVSVYNYNEYEHMVRHSSYENGKLTMEETVEYVYDDAGNYVTIKYIENGNHYQTDTYTVNDQGENIITRTEHFLEDGKSITEYDAYGNNTTNYFYDVDGTLITEIQNEYEQDADGNFHLARSTEILPADDYEYVTTYNVQGDVISAIDYYGGVETDSFYYEYQYDDEGRMVYQKVSDGTNSLQEIFYGVFVEEDGWYTYVQKEILYEIDGTMIVREFDENDVLVKETVYDAEGNVVQ